MTETAGVLYVATGRQHLEEAMSSLESLRAVHPGLPVTIVTDRGLPERQGVRTIVARETQGGISDKIRFLSRTPYRRTLFLDSDTHIAGDLTELFMLLDRFDLAASHASCGMSLPLEDVPESFPEFNTGVLLYRKSDQTDALIRRWLQIYEAQKNSTPKKIHDQPAFRKAVYESDLRIATLTPEYNCRLSHLGYVEEPVRILHRRRPNLKKMASVLNGRTGRRIYLIKNNEIALLGPQGRPLG